MKHYIVIEVRDDDPTRALDRTAAIRRNLHQFVRDQSQPPGVADIIVRGDREYTVYGAREPHDEVMGIFTRMMTLARRRG
jgi:hypothetical protein